MKLRLETLVYETAKQDASFDENRTFLFQPVPETRPFEIGKSNFLHPAQATPAFVLCFVINAEQSSGRPSLKFSKMQFESVGSQLAHHIEFYTSERSTQIHSR